MNNPFAGKKLKVPTDFKADVQKYVTKQEESSLVGAKLSQSPFPRVVDFWFIALCLGARKYTGRKKQAPSMSEFMDASILNSEPWRITLISLLAIGLTENPDIVREPGDIINLMNELAAAGTAELLSILGSKKNQPIWNLSDGLLDLVSPAAD
jgi:hypothetical protein